MLSFIGNDYYCDSARGSDNYPSVETFIPIHCARETINFFCSNSGMPWFCKTLPEPTVDNIEVRNCHSSPSIDEDTAVSLIELYVQWFFEMLRWLDYIANTL